MSDQILDTIEWIGKARNKKNNLVSARASWVRSKIATLRAFANLKSGRVADESRATAAGLEKKLDSALRRK